MTSPVKPTTPTTPTRGRKSNRTRRKGQVKLRFHHQALPQEYLDHYESTQKKILKQEKLNKKLHAMDTSNDDDDPNSSVKNWLQKISDITDDDITLSIVKAEPELDLLPVPPPKSSTKKSTQVSSSRMYNYNDLPYMGEMTLDNSKPRRGRKPKKQDICHLIYKNYGQILPGTPTPHSKIDKDTMTEEPVKQLTYVEDPKKTDIQNRIICSLLEKRLTQNLNSKKLEEKRLKALIEEPLNLCLRDYSLSTPGSSPTLSNSDDEQDSLIEHPLDIANDPILAEEEAPIKKFSKSLNLNSELSKLGEKTIDQMGNWSISKNQTNPSTSHYPKMMDQHEKSNLSLGSPKASTSKHGTVVPKNISDLIKKDSHLPPPTPSTTPSSVKSLDSFSSSSTSSNSTKIITRPSSTPSSISSSSSSNTAAPTQQKRKRSAIFIPPMPVDSSSNPTTEVSICKFKFTGGAKPSLQEKKMLSVDSGGNFRYYSGTGDKSMRGYEFFPRESLQQSSLLAGGSSSASFLNTPSEKIRANPNSDLTTEVLRVPKITIPIQSTNLSITPASIPSSSSQHKTIQPFEIMSPSSPAGTSGCGSTSTSRDSPSTIERKKRKSRRSIQREKLEKTFKEKGFLIQTQQLESAEGATYCKFRQLRRFTRYLFRSWKDYLPGDIQQTNVNNAINNTPPTAPN